jgi:hypothetical protein
MLAATISLLGQGPVHNAWTNMSITQDTQRVLPPPGYATLDGSIYLRVGKKGFFPLQSAAAAS